jgi:hypothetical protein
MIIYVIIRKPKKRRHAGSSLGNELINLSCELQWVLHDWGDKECIQILRKCREAIPEDKGKVIIVEAVIEEAQVDKLTDVRLALDMIMMAHTTTGKERTFKEWGFLLSEAGFRRYTVKPIRAVQSVIEAFP